MAASWYASHTKFLTPSEAAAQAAALGHRSGHRSGVHAWVFDIAGPRTAPSARSITAFFSCWNTASTPAASIGPGDQLLEKFLRQINGRRDHRRLLLAWHTCSLAAS
ncbi:hypothetical protein EWU18_24535, partial [Salmonella enterica subsp. enterica serovar Muenchen]|nr:hypothetical protein [Salmonella enterica subsp. enterica serovar Muenchen]